jgi:hypothetical protein
VVPADRVEGGGLPDLMIGGPIQVEGLPGVVEGLGVAVPPLPQVGEGVVDVGLLDPIAGPAVQVVAVSQLDMCVIEASQPGVGTGEEAVSAGLRGRVGQPPGGVLGGGEVVPVAPPVEEGGESSG